MRTGTIFASGGAKWMALLGVVSALGGPAAAEAQVPDVTVKALEAAPSVDEGGILVLEVTVEAARFSGSGAAPSITGKQATIEFDTSGAAEGEGAEVNEDLVLLGDTGLPDIQSSAEMAVEATMEFRYEVRRDLDAEDEKFEVSVRVDEATTGISRAVTIDDAEEQRYTLSLPDDSTSIIEGSAKTLTVRAEPARTVNIPLELALDPDEPAKVELGPLVGAEAFGPNPATAEVAARADGNRHDDEITVTAYTGSLGDPRVLGEPLTIAVEDIHRLPAGGKITARATMDEAGAADAASVAEGGKVYLTVTVDRGHAGYPEGEALDVELVPADPAQSPDFRLSTRMVTIPMGDGERTHAMAVELEAVENDDVGPETLVLNLVATGAESDNGPGSSTGTFSIVIEDITERLVWANPQNVVEDIIYDAKNDGMGGDGMFTTGETIAIDATLLFDHADVAGLTIEYAASSDDEMVASASASGGEVMVTATSEMSGMAQVTITAAATLPSGVTIVTQTERNVARIVFPVEVSAVVPALPVIARLLLAAFLAIGGYRRYRRR